MKSCQIWGGLSADRTDEQYPTVTVCDECAEANQGHEDSAITHILGGYDAAYGEECHFCDKTEEEEREEA
ncbi:hypothetical protein [Pseudogulbenkiania ferrooxidans]|uniref:hypothetical protein n=1 Tax=Pseudogulbenkiania ferrooxidans TaxID=549169 RepID=UPI0009DC0C64|nr:hypothetical protein [Pseudogulbenkiania ferrooxidans]